MIGIAKRVNGAEVGVEVKRQLSKAIDVEVEAGAEVEVDREKWGTQATMEDQRIDLR